MAAYLSVIGPGDRILGMKLAHGGHLTHGSPVTMSGILFEAHSYGIDPDSEMIDYEQVLKVAKDVRPKVIIAGASAYSRTIDFERFRQIANDVDAILLADIAHIAGIIAAGLHPTPIGHAQITTTTTHKTLRGPRGGMIMADEAHATAVNRTLFPGLQGGPLMHVIAAKAVAFGEALQPDFKDYVRRLLANARTLSDTIQEFGLRVVSGGTDNHLMLVDLTAYDVSGRKIQRRLEKAGITTNRNSIPNDPRSPFQTSGVRLGSAAVTTRGFGEQEMVQIGRWIAEVVQNPDDQDNLERIGREAADLASSFPLPGVSEAVLRS